MHLLQADEVVDKVVKEAISKPWLPLPLGLKPPSTDSVLAELSRQGISTIPHETKGCKSEPTWSHIKYDWPLGPISGGTRKAVYRVCVSSQSVHALLIVILLFFFFLSNLWDTIPITELVRSWDLGPIYLIWSPSTTMIFLLPGKMVMVMWSQAILQRH